MIIMVRIHERDKDGKLLIFESEKERNDYHWRHEGKPFVLMLFFFIVLVVIGYFLPESKEKPSDSFTQKTEAEANKKTLEDSQSNKNNQPLSAENADEQLVVEDSESVNVNDVPDSEDAEEIVSESPDASVVESEVQDIEQLLVSFDNVVSKFEKASFIDYEASRSESLKLKAVVDNLVSQMSRKQSRRYRKISERLEKELINYKNLKSN